MVIGIHCSVLLVFVYIMACKMAYAVSFYSFYFRKVCSCTYYFSFNKLINFYFNKKNNNCMLAYKLASVPFSFSK